MTITDTLGSTLGARETYERLRLDQLSDVQLAAHAAATIRVPRSAPADSFVLHAPLELMARAALLPRVRPAQRDLARLRIFAVAHQFSGTGPPVADAGTAVGDFDSIEHATGRLVAAIDAGDLDDIDPAARWLGRTASPAELQRLLASALVPRLGAAAHAPILLYHLPRVSPRGEITGELVRGAARELGRYPDWRLHWIDDRPTRTGAGPEAGPDAVFDALAATPSVGPPDSTFIFPLMSAVDTDGTAAGVLRDVVGGDDVAARGRAILRAAAWTMVLEPPDHAPYGWSHCLTMPQAVLGLAPVLDDPSVALAIAGTYVVGFRAALAGRPLVPELAPADHRLPLAEAIDAGPETAVAAVWHAPPHAADEIIAELVTRASVAHDAHFVKYTLACLDAAAADPAHTRLFLAAAASLAGFWAPITDPDDPLA